MTNAVQGELISVNGGMEVIFKEIHYQIDLFEVPEVAEEVLAVPEDAAGLENEVREILDQLSEKPMSHAEGYFKSVPELKYQFHGMSDLTHAIYRLGTAEKVLFRKTERYTEASATIIKFIKSYQEQ